MPTQEYAPTVTRFAAAEGGMMTAPWERTPTPEELASIRTWAREDEARRAKAREAAHRRREAHRARHSAVFLAVESELTQVRRHMNHALREAEGVPFTDDERELMADSLGKLRARLNEVDEAFRKRIH